MKNKIISRSKLRGLLTFMASMALISLSIQWKPEDLLRNQLAKDLIDRNNYLNEESIEFQQVKNLIYNIKNKHNLDIKIVIFNRMNYEYKGNIELFVDELAYKFAYENREKDYDSLIIAFAIEDRKMRIRTGKNIKRKLSDYSAQNILEDPRLKSNLKNHNYTIALRVLLEKLNEKLSGISDESGGYVALVILTLAFIFFTVQAICSCCSKKRKTIQEKLEKIKQLTESKKNKKQFIEDNCIICLEEFAEKEVKKPQNAEEQPKSKNSYRKVNNNQENQNIIKEDNNDSNQEFKKKSTEPKLDEDNAAFSLECGHTFHKKCIASWMDKKNFCPLCKAKIDVEEDDHNYKSIQENLVEIQTEFHPELRQWDWTYSNNTFSWRNPREVVNSGNAESYSNDNDNGCSNESGGASSEW